MERITSHLVDPAQEPAPFPHPEIHRGPVNPKTNAAESYGVAYANKPGVLGTSVVLNFVRSDDKMGLLPGLTNEALLAVVEDRLAGYQDGPFACAENADALKHVRGALKALTDREKRMVEEWNAPRAEETATVPASKNAGDEAPVSADAKPSEESPEDPPKKSGKK